ncbi:LOW QUALITY PROTEIN: protein Z-dependent protease inhibitor [Urocitellus parryii]
MDVNENRLLFSPSLHLTTECMRAGQTEPAPTQELRKSPPCSFPRDWRGLLNYDPGKTWLKTSLSVSTTQAAAGGPDSVVLSAGRGAAGGIPGLDVAWLRVRQPGRFASAFPLDTGTLGQSQGLPEGNCREACETPHHWPGRPAPPGPPGPRTEQGLLLSVLLAEMRLVPGLALSPGSPEAHAGMDTMEPQPPQNQTRRAESQVESSLHLALSHTTPLLLPLFKLIRETLSTELGLAQGSFAFIHKDFDCKETFPNSPKRSLDKAYACEFSQCPQAQGIMNIHKEPQGEVPQLFDEINQTKLILVDHILEAAGRMWPTFTKADTFHLDKSKAVKVPVMYRAGKSASTFDKKVHCHVLPLPYGNATMLVVLMGNTGDHLALEGGLTTELVETWLRNRFFQSVIEDDEKGTEAVAGTLTEITYSLPPVTKVPRPFHLRVYKETSRVLLFLRVVNPISCDPPPA